MQKQSAWTLYRRLVVHKLEARSPQILWKCISAAVHWVQWWCTALHCTRRACTSVPVCVCDGSLVCIVHPTVCSWHRCASQSTQMQPVPRPPIPMQNLIIKTIKINIFPAAVTHLSHNYLFPVHAQPSHKKHAITHTVCKAHCKHHHCGVCLPHFYHDIAVIDHQEINNQQNLLHPDDDHLTQMWANAKGCSGAAGINPVQLRSTPIVITIIIIIITIIIITVTIATIIVIIIITKNGSLQTKVRSCTALYFSVIWKC